MDTQATRRRTVWGLVMAAGALARAPAVTRAKGTGPAAPPRTVLLFPAVSAGAGGETTAAADPGTPGTPGTPATAAPAAPSAATTQLQDDVTEALRKHLTRA